MKRLIFIFCVSIILISACNPRKEQGQNESIVSLQTGTWKGVVKPQGIEIPFIVTVEESGGKYVIELINAKERIPLDEVIIDNDSIHIPLFIFDATIHAKIEDDKMNGIWVKNYAEDYIIPFEAFFENKDRFLIQNQNSKASFDGKWEVDFIIEGGIDKAIGVFKQQENKLTGTFLLPTGDYRFLEGVVDGDMMKLSCFDGTHAYLFEAHMLKNGQVEGEFWSGKSWHQKWTAKRNDDFELPDPYAMTFIKDGYDKFEIKFPNTSGELIKLTDSKFTDKVVVVQILGTWCANCMDETIFYTNWYKKNKGREVEIIGLAFERKADKDYAISRINKMKKKLGV
ncbi:MAG: redoxin domain-containing protein, partial [Cyclobacteriaceae bacterium]|nr:redoxin domain-containing protein [Cyclobacteriaceae bacterium]